MSERVDIGHGVTVSLCYYPTKAEAPSIADDIAGKLAGIDYWHPCRTQNDVPGYVPLGGKDGWTLEKFEPLTLSPSLLCRACGHHGFIKEGRWIPC
jgi:hypothetical protein